MVERKTVMVEAEEVTYKCDKCGKVLGGDLTINEPSDFNPFNNVDIKVMFRGGGRYTTMKYPSMVYKKEDVCVDCYKEETERMIQKLRELGFSIEYQ